MKCCKVVAKRMRVFRAVARGVAGGLFALWMTATVQAGVISVDQFIVDTDQAGLNFLAPIHSAWAGSYNYISTQFGVGGDFEGFRYATDSEVVLLINNFMSGSGFPTVVAGGPSAVVSGSFGTFPAQRARVAALVNLLGATGVEGSVWGTHNDLARVVRGLTGDEASIVIPGFSTLEGRRMISILDYDVDVAPNADGIAAGGLWFDDQNLPTIGHWLVQEVSTDPVPVPEPATLGLLVLGLLVLRLTLEQKKVQSLGFDPFLSTRRM